MEDYVSRHVLLRTLEWPVRAFQTTESNLHLYRVYPHGPAVTVCCVPVTVTTLFLSVRM